MISINTCCTVQRLDEESVTDQKTNGPVKDKVVQRNDETVL